MKIFKIKDQQSSNDTVKRNKKSTLYKRQWKYILKISGEEGPTLHNQVHNHESF